MHTVLISGAGVAGPILAYWLCYHGFRPAIVEQAPAARPGGQAIDVRGAALTVAERMGLLEDLRSVRTRMRGMSVLDADGQELWRSTEKVFSSGRLDSDDLELLRDDLTTMLHLRTRNDVEYLFGDSIRALDEDADGVRVEFANRGSRVFDLVVGADGLHSNVRRIAFGAEQCFVEHLGTYVAVFSMENLLQLDNWQVWLQAGDAGYAIYPVRGNSELRVTLGFRSVPLTYDYHDVQRQKQIVEERLADMRWETPRLLEGMRKAPDFYFDAMAQVRMPRWSVGRVALVGDACYCASPLSGQGTSLALVGAYVLAEELGRARDDHRGAFSAYQKRMRSFVELNQQLATENPGEPAPEESIERAKNAISLC